MDLEPVSEELYRAAPRDFTAARDHRVTEAREAGDAALAASLKKLRKPTVGAWLANLLAHERSEDLEHLIKLGAELRGGQNRADGQLIRRVSKEKQDTVAKLLQRAKSMAARRGQPVSGAAAIDLEATLDAAFADPKAAESVRAGRLTTAVHYSGLGLAESGPKTSPRTGRNTRSGSGSAAAKRDLELANREAARADAEVEKARHAVVVAEDNLKKLRAAATLAVRRAKDAHKKASAAHKKVRS